MSPSQNEQVKVRQFEPWFELMFWLSAVGCMLLTLHPQVPGNPRHMLALGAVVLVFTLVYYRLLPKIWAGFWKTFFGCLVAIGFITALFLLTGALRSPFSHGGLYLMPIIAAFLVLDQRRAWMVYAAAVVSWGTLWAVTPRGDDWSTVQLALLIKVFGMTTATLFTALIGRRLYGEILEERKLIKQLRESQMHMEHMTAQLSRLNSELQHMARVKDEFVAMINHELRTPLTAIRQGVAMFMDGTFGPLTDEQREYLGVVQRNTGQLYELIANLLDLSKLQAGKLTIRLQPCHLDRLVTESLQLMQPLVGNRTVRYDLDGVPPVVADPQRLAQVLNNLLSNAIKFTGATGEITIGARQLHQRVALNVSDNGVGIAAEQVPKLFRRFERPETDVSRPGTGLGLAICRELMELQRGTIAIASPPGGGTTVTLELPVSAPVGAHAEVAT